MRFEMKLSDILQFWNCTKNGGCWMKPNANGKKGTSPQWRGVLKSERPRAIVDHIERMKLGKTMDDSKSSWESHIDHAKVIAQIDIARTWKRTKRKIKMVWKTMLN